MADGTGSANAPGKVPLHQTPSYRQHRAASLAANAPTATAPTTPSIIKQLSARGPFASPNTASMRRADPDGDGAPLMMEMHALDARGGISTAPTHQPPNSHDSFGIGAPRDIHKREVALQRWRQTRNWDNFYQRVYDYYSGKGIYTMLLSRLVRLITVAFVVCFSTFLVSCIDHRDIANRATLADAIIPHCLNTLHPFIQMTLVLFGAFGAWELARMTLSIRPLLGMHAFFEHVLGIPDQDMQSIHWKDVVSRLVHLQQSTPPPTSASAASGAPQRPTRLNAHDITNRIMRQDNYLVALFNKDLLDLSIPLPKWLLLGFGEKQMLTKVLEWHLRASILGFVFGVTEQGKEIAVRRHFLRDVQRAKLIAGLQRRLFLMGLLNLVFAPFILVVVAAYFFFKYGEEVHKNPTQLSARTYSPLARWKFRDFNELPHAFHGRLNASYPPAIKYINQFPQYKLAIVAKFVSFVAGSVALSLAFLSVLDDDFLIKFHLTPGRSVLWYLGLFSMVWSAARGFIPDPHLVYDPEVLLREVATHTHYLPEQWQRRGLHSDHVRREFSNLFDYRLVLFVQEVLSVVFAPFVLWFSLPSCVPRIVDFFREFTVHVDGVGWVCSLAVFDVAHFNEQRGIVVPTAASSGAPPPGTAGTSRAATQTSAATVKMEQSMLAFKHEHPDWTPRDPAAALLVKQLLEAEAASRYDPSVSMFSTASAPEKYSSSSVHLRSRDHAASSAVVGGLDLAGGAAAGSTGMTHGSTVLEGGAVPYVPYAMYREQQQQQQQHLLPSTVQQYREPAAELSVQSGLVSARYVPPPLPDDD